MGDVPLFRELPLDRQTRTPKEVTQALTTFTGIRVGVKYRVQVYDMDPRTDKLNMDRWRTFTGKCLWARGPDAAFAPNYNVNILEIKEIREIE